jgi:hypothetical protein
MSKLECARCGWVIVDVADDLPYKAFVTGDAEASSLRASLAKALAELVAARGGTAREGWFRRHFRHDPPARASDEDVAFHLLANAEGPVRRLLYECVECGTMHLQAAPGDPRFVPYAPVDAPAPGVLAPAGSAARRGAGGR